MSKITIDNFVGTRTRFQRLRDAKIFSGWIESYFGSRLELSTNTNHAVQIGDEFRIEGYGHKVSMVVSARLVEIAQLDLLAEGMVTAVAGTNSRIVEAKRVLLRLEVTSPVRFSGSTENVRIKTKSIPVLLEQGKEFQGFCLDVGAQGFSFTTTEPVAVNEEIRAQLQTNQGVIRCSGNVRYCRLDRDREGMNRCGVHLNPFDRTTGPKWEAFIDSLE